MIPWRGMQPSTARDSGQVDPRRSTTDIPSPQSAALGLHPVARRLLLINRPRRDGTLSRRWYTAATGGSRTHDLAIAKSSLVPLGHRVPCFCTVGGLCLLFNVLLVWHAPLGVRSAKLRHQSPEWTILSIDDCFIQGQVFGFHVLLDSLHPRSTRASWW